jgi:hypothetical protein
VSVDGSLGARRVTLGFCDGNALRGSSIRRCPAEYGAGFVPAALRDVGEGEGLPWHSAAMDMLSATALGRHREPLRCRPSVAPSARV